MFFPNAPGTTNRSIIHKHGLSVRPTRCTQERRLDKLVRNDHRIILRGRGHYVIRKTYYDVWLLKNGKNVPRYAYIYWSYLYLQLQNVAIIINVKCFYQMVTLTAAAGNARDESTSPILLSTTVLIGLVLLSVTSSRICRWLTLRSLYRHRLDKTSILILLLCENKYWWEKFRP